MGGADRADAGDGRPESAAGRPARGHRPVARHPGGLHKVRSVHLIFECWRTSGRCRPTGAPSPASGRTPWRPAPGGFLQKQIVVHLMSSCSSFQDWLVRRAAHHRPVAPLHILHGLPPHAITKLLEEISCLQDFATDSACDSALASDTAELRAQAAVRIQYAGKPEFPNVFQHTGATRRCGT